MRRKVDLRRALARSWLLVAMLAAIALVLAGAAWSAAVEREQSLAEFSERQALLATAVGTDFENRLAGRRPDRDDEILALFAGAQHIEKPGEILVLVARPGAAGLLTLDHRIIPSHRVRAALDGTGSTVIIPRDEAAAFGLPRRTAVAGLARIAPRTGERWGVVVLATAQSVRDRQIHEQWRLAGTVLLVTLVAIAFGTAERRRQRAELEREREAALAKAEKMAALAALSTGIAHELGTPLGVIVGRVEQVSERTTDERAGTALRVVLEQVDRIRGIVRGCLALARGEAPLLVKTPAATVAEHAVDLVRHRFENAGVAIECELGEALPPIACDHALLEQAIVNLLVNACEATPRDGRVRLHVRADDGRVEFIVDDDGAGIADDVVEKATEPFFSTRREQGGSGLGLTIAREIVGHHGGSIRLARREGGSGTRATITVTA